MKKLLGTLGMLFILSFVSINQSYALENSVINVSYDLSERLIGHLKSHDRNTNIYNTIDRNLQKHTQNMALPQVYRTILEVTQKTMTDLYKKQQDDNYFARMKEFRAKYNIDFQTAYDDPKNLSNCFAHYPLVDEYARITNKPTPLLLAMWFIESSCGMYNPANGDGLFQIVSNYYTPGNIDRAGLYAQLSDFAAFMDRKRSWYYGKNTDSPKELSYTEASYDALQTFAALYNGYDIESGFYRYPLLNGNPYYFLGNYNADYKSKRDGLLVFYIKLSKMEADYFGK